MDKELIKFELVQQFVSLGNSTEYAIEETKRIMQELFPDQPVKPYYVVST